jgi:hypothetical protein
MTADALIVATHAKWVFKDFEKAILEADRAIPSAYYSHGLGLPNLERNGRKIERPAVWTSTAHATNLKRSGMLLPLLAPGPQWLPGVPEHLRGRNVYATTLGDLRNDPVAMDDEHLHWIKLAEMKDDRLPAQRVCIRDFVLKAESLGAPDGTNIQYSPDHLTIVREDRFFILNHRVITGSPYARLNYIWDADADRSDWQYSEWAANFAQYAATTMRKRSPRAYTLDVAQVMDVAYSDDHHVVLEANPAWSSALYGSNVEKVARAVLAAVDYDGTQTDHQWQPDPWLIQKAKKRVPLKPE